VRGNIITAAKVPTTGDPTALTTALIAIVNLDHALCMIGN
jgi:hypothetical protein